MSQMAIKDPEAYQEMILSGGFWLKILFMFTFVLISGLITIATINSYIVLYGEKKTNEIEVGEVWERVRSTFWTYLTTMIFFALLFVVVYMALLIPVFILAYISPSLMFIGITFVICALFYLMISLSLTFIIRTYENKGFIDAVIRSFKLVHGKWWSTFGLILILYFIMVVIAYIPVIPFYVAMFAKDLHTTTTNPFESPSPTWQIITTVMFTLYYLLQMFLNTLPNVGIAFQYFNLVELKESKGLLSEIQTLGTQQEAPRPEEHF